MKELWVTGSSWGADRCWCWQIERVIIQSSGDELVLVLAGSPGSGISPNHTSIHHAHTSLAQCENSTIERRWSCRWKSGYRAGVPSVTTGALSCSLLTLELFISSAVNCNSYLIFVEGSSCLFQGVTHIRLFISVSSALTELRTSLQAHLQSGSVGGGVVTTHFFRS